jgi:hypothetical protein
MATAYEALQKALYARLTTHPGVQARVTGVFDQISAKVAFPYLLFGDATGEEASTAGTTLQRVSLALMILSDAAGRAESLALQAEVEAALATPLVLTDGWQCTALYCTRAEAQTLDGGRRRRVTLRLEAWLEKP